MASDAFTVATELSGQASWSMIPDNVSDRTGSPLQHTDNIRIPFLILHGEKGSRVPVSHARAFHIGCLRRGVEFQTVTQPGEGHGGLVPFENAHSIYVQEMTKILFYEPVDVDVQGQRAQWMR